MTTAPRDRRNESTAQRGIPDGALIGFLLLLLGTVALTWVATGLAGFVQYGSWPDIKFAHTALALRRLATRPSDLEAAWSHPDPVPGLPTPTAFWTTLFILVAVLLAVSVLGMTAWTRFRAPVKAQQARVRAVQEAAERAAAAPAPAAVPMPVQPPRPQSAPRRPARTETVPVPQPPLEARPETPAERPPAVPVEAAAPVAAQVASPAPRHPLAEQALVSRARAIRPEIPVIGRSLHDVLAYAIGLGHDSADGTELFGGLDQTFSVYGSPGTGKSSRLVHRAVTHAPGPVLVTCDGPSTLHATSGAREKTGPVLVFDPLQLSDTAQRLRWSPVQGCEDPSTAESRARALLEPVRPLARTLLSDANTQQTAHTLLRCLLHAAALDGRPIRQVHRWANGQGTRDAVKVLRTTKDAAADWAGSLESTLSGHPQQLEAGRALTARALDFLSQLHVLNSCTPSGSEQLNVESFLCERGTLYLVGEASEDPRSHPGAMPLLTALAAHVVEHGRRMAARSSSGRLDPPMLCALDDVATLAPLPVLPELMSVGGKVGIPTLAVLRSEEQARHRWGDRGATTIHQSSGVRVTMDADTAGTAKLELNDGHRVVARL
ncbi:type IV secretory system conjugative DNA transfer family protein [Wenjunlia tyrosinilytica]|uniref:TraD/TraG TraM recognition site domain-containing protein n=1 Tax=Wenjunlia tyrosinilytica TaxID=1544741 RepID=A0A917ZMN6_9ACTN|nr:TraM recognition domain-containing protein [Wenjunlia tyrosinilytica]GGO87378.1 hypothetical protein GCM10012280_25730 [Wenjunlia tyrosinilytica]